MVQSRNSLYSLIVAACIAGYGWLYYSWTTQGPENKTVEACLFKHATSLPCPSCGSTRSVIFLTHGNFAQAFMINPLGYVVAFCMLIAPLWIATDLAAKQNTLFLAYRKFEKLIRRRRFAVVMVSLVLINWFWNISKGL